MRTTSRQNHRNRSIRFCGLTWSRSATASGMASSRSVALAPIRSACRPCTSCSPSARAVRLWPTLTRSHHAVSGITISRKASSGKRMATSPPTIAGRAVARSTPCCCVVRPSVATSDAPASDVGSSSTSTGPPSPMAKVRHTS